MTSRSEEFMTALVEGDSAKVAGIYAQLITEHSLLNIALDSLILRDARGDKILANAIRATLLHDVSLEMQKQLGIENNDIP